ncbi:MAG TPA: hypothetical protein VKR52_20915 [Terracidiphilus sp.]|nr:hypothetical protein [Terracidiphilus sp.]
MINSRWPVFLLTVLCPLACANANGQGPLPSAKQIIAQYDQALGGRDAIMRHSSSTTRGSMEVHDGPTVFKTSLVYYARAPYQRLEKVSLPNGRGDLLNGFDGEVAWSFDPRPDGGAQISSGDDRESAKRDADFYYPLSELSWFKSMDTAGVETFEGRPCFRLHGINNWNKANDHFYDVETHLLAGYEFASPMGLTHEIFSDYRKMDGVLVPMKQTVKVQAKDGTWNPVYLLTFDSVTFNDVDPSVFTLPPSVRAIAEKEKQPAKP